MRYILFTSTLLLTIALLYAGNSNHPLGSSLPPLGKLLDPFSGFWQNAEPVAAPNSEVVDLPGIKDKVEVIFDERLVPHIFATNNYDACYAQGYITAKYRLWQMDFITRAASGRLSEVIGEKTLERDRLQRRKGMVLAAERTLQAWSDNSEEMPLIEAYTAGINDYIAGLQPADYPLEFKLLDYAPEPWTTLKTAIAAKSMAETLCFRNDDLQSTNTLRMLGDSLFNDIFPDYPPGQTPVIPAGTAWPFTPVKPQQTAPAPPPYGDLIRFALPNPPPFIGSNNWAVAGQKTTTGYPILCNDPHLSLSLPSIWFEIHMNSGECNTYGVSFPGTPGILIGFNEFIAWGETNVSHDVLDWYSLTWVDDAKTEYLLDGQPRKVEYRIEEIAVKGRRKPVLDTVKYTVWGPVVYPDPASPYHDMAMHWLSLDKPENQDFHEVGVFHRLMCGHSYEDYYHALSGLTAPAQNFVFASSKGDIAMTVNGRFPIKSDQQGRFLQKGDLSANGWKGFIPYEQIPRVKNPPQGFVASANQHSVAPDYPYYYNGQFDMYRGRFINRLLSEKKKFSASDMMAMQNNNYSIQAEEGLPALLSALDTGSLSAIEQDMRHDLRAWDFHFDKNKKAPVVFLRWLNRAYKDTFDEWYTSPDSNYLDYPDMWRFVALLATTPNHPLFDQAATGKRETARDIVTQAYKIISAELADQYHNSDFNWKTEKGVRIGHLAGIDAFSKLNVDMGGHKDAINAMQKSFGPSWRMVVSLGPELKAWGVYPGGQSGNPGSRFYDSMVNQWAEGAYNELLFVKTPDALRDHEQFRITFQ